MNNFKDYSLELNKRVNNIKLEKLILDIKHNIIKEDIVSLYKNYDFDMENYIGFDLESLNDYENWLGENIGWD